MKKIAVGLICLMLLGSTAISFADGVVVPMAIKIEKFKKEMKKCGIDLYGRDSSDGFVESKGNEMKVITYKPVTSEQLETIKQCAVKSVRK